MFNDDKDEVLSEILDGLIDFQERSPSVSNTSMASTMASRADERRISDIERFLVSSEHSLLQQQQKQQHQQQQQQQQNTKPKISSLAASAPSLTSILSAPPLALTGRPPPNGARGPVITGGNTSGKPGGNPVNLVPRMNELLQQVPPNVSIPDTPDLDSLILLQERRRRMSSGGGNGTGNSTSSAVPTTTSPRPPSQPGFQTPSQQLQTVSSNQQPPNRGQLLMQHLTSNTTMSRSASMASSGPSVTRSISYMEPTNNQFNGAGSANSVPTTVPQVLARRSSFSGGLPQPNATPSNNPPMISPPPGASAAAAAVAAAAAASTANSRPQRHASGGSTVHHVLRGAGISGNGNQRRLSGTLETVSSDEKQRSLLQQLLSE